MLYNKLVRDLIPQVIVDSGKTPVTRVLADDEYRQELEKKLQEEVTEYLQSDGDIYELADILEVIFAVAENRGYTCEKVLEKKELKKQERGGFSKKIFLKETN